MAITFKYVNVPRSDGTLRKAPFIPIHLRDDNNKLLRFVGLVDSGADTTVIPKDVALILGLKESPDFDQTGGIGGSVNVKTTSLSFQIQGDHEHHNLTIPALVLQDSNADVPLLIGRSGFFENFHVKFKQNLGRITLKKVSANNF